MILEIGYSSLKNELFGKELKLLVRSDNAPN